MPSMAPRPACPMKFPAPLKLAQAVRNSSTGPIFLSPIKYSAAVLEPPRVFRPTPKQKARSARTSTAARIVKPCDMHHTPCFFCAFFSFAE